MSTGRTETANASAYLLKAYQRETGRATSDVPLELHESVVVCVMSVGYTKRMVDDLVRAYVNRGRSGGSEVKS